MTKMRVLPRVVACVLILLRALSADLVKIHMRASGHPEFFTALGAPSKKVMISALQSRVPDVVIIGTKTDQTFVDLTVYGRHRVVDANMFLAPLCNVTEESGLTSDCAQVIGYLQFLDNADCCVHEHREVNHCTTMHVAGTCRAQICSLPFVPLPRCQPCRAVAEYVRTVTNLCAQDVAGASRSGGYQVMQEDGALFIVLY